MNEPMKINFSSGAYPLFVAIFIVTKIRTFHCYQDYKIRYNTYIVKI
jgi:hypothetical protein